MQVLLQQMMLMNTNLANMQQTPHNGPSNPTGRGRGRGIHNAGRGGHGRGRGRFTRTPRVMRYCHSCGWCTHDGVHCHFPKEGHKPDATIDNSMGGSCDGLPPNHGSA